MARSITLTLGAGLGANLGPNFNLTANVGSVTPSTATKSELTSGKSVSVDDAASQVTVTSTGTCTNAITQTIPCATTTTTTTAAPVCDQYEIQNFTESSIAYSYYDCDGINTLGSIGSGNNLIFCAAVSYGAIDAGGGTLTNIGSCAGGTTTTTAAPPLESVFCDCGFGCEEYFQPFCPPGCEACII
jgi:hypothetical protein